MTLKTRMEKIINSGYSNIGGIVVKKGERLVYEKYYNGCTASTRFHVFSVTKSIISILLGIAVDKGDIKSTNQKVLEFFPDYQVKRGENTIQSITLKNLLTMTAPYKYKSEPYSEYFASDNWVKSSLDLLGGKGRVGEFKYAPLIGPDIFSGILVNVTGRSVLDFATEYLFMPLGITVNGNVVFQNKEEQLEYLNKKDFTGWVAGPNGVNTGGWGLSLTAEDMSKIGQLYLDKGVYKGRKIISPGWIYDSTKEQSRCSQWKLSYGYLWWIIDRNEHAYAAMGDGGNVIYVNEEKELVIAIASLFQPKAKDRITLIKDYIEPVFAREDTLCK